MANGSGATSWERRWDMVFATGDIALGEVDLADLGVAFGQFGR
jgi:hypothetical protein